jgi:hypothetical protein
VSSGALTALVIVETIVLGLLAVIVVSLLRSHAELLRRLPAVDEHDHDGQLHDATRSGSALDRPAMPADLPAPKRLATQAHDVVGTTLDGDHVVVSAASGSSTLFAFLSSGCLTCQGFWEGLHPDVRKPLPGDARVVVVVKDPAYESPSKLARLAPPDVPVVQSSAAWDDFEVRMSPYFCFVEGATGDVRSEGAAMTWDQVSSLLTDALFDEEAARAAGGA